MLEKVQNSTSSIKMPLSYLCVLWDSILGRWICEFDEMGPALCLKSTVLPASLPLPSTTMNVPSGSFLVLDP
jgi:hypothetical protein